MIVPKCSFCMLLLIPYYVDGNPAYPIGMFLQLGDDQGLSAALSFLKYQHDTDINLNNCSFNIDFLYATIYTPQSDAYGTWKSVCELMKHGFFGMLVSANHNSISYYDSLALTMQVPYVSWQVVNRLLGAHVKAELSEYGVMMAPPIHKLMADWILHKGWTELIILQDDIDAGIDLELIYEELQYHPLKTVPIECQIVRLPNNEFDFDEFIFQFHKQRYNRRVAEQYHVIVQITSRRRQKRFLNSIKTLALQSPDRFHYVMADFGITIEDIQMMHLRFLNFTAFQIVNHESDLYKSLQATMKQAHEQKFNRQQYLKRDSGDDERKKTSEISTEAALVFDSAQVLIESMRKFDFTFPSDGGLRKMFHRGQFLNAKQRGLYCVPSEDPMNPKRKFRVFTQGQKLARLLRRAKLTGQTTFTGPIEFNNRGIRSNFSVDIYDLTYSPNTVWGTETIHKWHSEKGIMNGRSKERNLNNDLNTDGRGVVRVTTVIVEPFAFYTSSRKSNEIILDGYCVELVKMMAEIMGFTYEIHVVRDGKYGGVDESGTWNGMIGELIRNESDMAVAPLTISRTRERVVDFSKPFITTGISIMIKKPDKQDYSVFSFLQPLSNFVWVSLVICIVSRFSPYEWRVEEAPNGQYFTVENDFTVLNTLYFTLAAFVQQSTDLSPQSISNRIASSAWWFFTMIIIASYTANLAAFLTSEKLTASIESIDHLAKQTKIKYGIQGGGSTQSFFKTSSVKQYQKMWRFMEKQKPSVLTKTYAEGIKKVRDAKGKYAFLLEATANEYANTRTPCDTMKVGEMLNSVGYGVATSFGSPYRHKISLAILELQEKGGLKKLENKWWYDRSQCEATRTDSMTVALNLSKVAGVFYILIFAMLLALTVACVEYWYKKRKVQRMTLDSVLTDKNASIGFLYDRDEDIHGDKSIENGSRAQSIPLIERRSNSQKSIRQTDV